MEAFPDRALRPGQPKMPLGPRRLSNRTAGASGLTPEEHAKCSERSEHRLFDALHIQRELFRVWLFWSDVGGRVLMRPVPRTGRAAWH